MAVEYLHGLYSTNTESPIPTTNNDRHDQVNLWAMAIIRSRESGLRNRGVAVNEIDQQGDEYAQFIPSLLADLHAKITVTIETTNMELNTLEPVFLDAQMGIDLQDISFSESEGVRARWRLAERP